MSATGKVCNTSGEDEVGVYYHPNDSLAQAMVTAWNDEEFRGRLLTFGNDKKPLWKNISETEYKKRLDRTRDALVEAGIPLDSPVVLTQEQYENGYVKRKDDEIVFMLPNQPKKLLSGLALNTARVMMAIHCDGM